jgi:hypothetical protein
MSKAVRTRLDPRDQDIGQRYIRARVDIRDNGCWEWRGFKLHAGHGQAKWEGYPVKAHRLSYAAFVSEPGELMVCHHCDNPPCCNPAHLFLGTKGDNNRDAARKGRYASRPKNPNPRRGAAHPSAKVTFDMYWEAHAMKVAERATNKSIAATIGVNTNVVGWMLDLRSGHWTHTAYGPLASEAAE